MYKALRIIMLVVVLSAGDVVSGAGEEVMGDGKASPDSGTPGSTYVREFRMPGVSPKTAEEYFCTSMALNISLEEWVVGFEPLATANTAHHMLLYGCSDVPKKLGAWECGHHGVCTNGRIMYAWAKNAPATTLPSKVGFKIGGDTGIKFLTLQIHYAVALPDIQDHSGLSLKLTQQQQQYKAGILLMVDGATKIPGGVPKVHADIACLAKRANVLTDIHVFGYRVHTHSLGRVVSGYKYDLETGNYTLIAKGNPQWPQAFYPRDEYLTIRPTDMVAARCTYNATERDRTTFIGSTSADEMCNLYLMYYTDREKGSEAAVCSGGASNPVIQSLPEGNDTPLPPNPMLEMKAHGENTNKHSAEVTYRPVSNSQPIVIKKKVTHYGANNPQGSHPKLHPMPVGQSSQAPEDHHKPSTNRTDKDIEHSEYRVVRDWPPSLPPTMGQITAVSVDSNRDVIIFHRGRVVWDGSSFTADERLANTSAVIPENTILHLSGTTGEVIHQWGADFFHMPHGLTVDSQDQLWLTDVGMHQVFRFPKLYGNSTPSLTLGVRFEPGSDDSHFCKPTSVAVMSTGEFFVADGYCNGRIIKYDKDGKMITQFGKKAPTSFLGAMMGSASPPGTFRVPHGLALAEDRGEVCVADRENGRVQCYDVTDTPRHTRLYKLPQWGARVFSVAYSPHGGGRVYCVNGPQPLGGHMVQVYELDFASGKLLSTFSPNNQGLTYAHDVAVTDDGAEFYVSEIGPSKLWKFTSESLLKARPNAASLKHATDEASLHAAQILKGVGVGISKLGTNVVTHWSTGGVSIVVLGLLAVPIVVLTSVSLIVRAKRRGKIGLRNSVRSSSNSHQANGGSTWRSEAGLHQLGSSLLHKHRGFRQLATEDIEDPSSGDSDVEEFSQMATKA